MSYNNRNYGRQPQQNSRYNTSGQFVAAGELNSPSTTPVRNTRATAAALNTNNFGSLYPSGTNPPPPQAPVPSTPLATAAQQFQAKAAQQNYGNSALPAQSAQQVLPKVETMEVTAEEGGAAEDGAAAATEKIRPAWMKSGIRKISNKERRRRQNEHLRKLLTPKNALMVLNEMMPGEQVNNNFTVEAAPVNNMFFRQDAGHKFCAGLSLDGNLYKGFGENKLTARNSAAEQAIRDLVIKRMTKALAASTAAAAAAAGAEGLPVNITEGNGEAAAEGAEEPSEEGETLPMIQLASYALHKLFTEWQYEGFQVPLLKRPSGDVFSGDQEPIVAAPPKPKPPKRAKSKDLPANAPTMHPSMLLTQMRPGAAYHELGSEGDKPQNMIFTMGVTVDGTTYIGKASNKKEARKQAARSACTALFNMQFLDTA